MSYFAATGELDGRVRYAEYDAAGDAGGYLVRAGLSGAATVVVAVFGPRLITS